MEISMYGQITYRAEADKKFPGGCTEGNNSGGECGWCQVYYGWDLVSGYGLSPPHTKKEKPPTVSG